MITQIVCTLIASSLAYAEPEIKIALLGDTGAGKEFASVLQLVANESPTVVMINGDFGYGSGPRQWEDRLKSTVELSKFPVIGSLGNHDVENDNAKDYIAIFKRFRNDGNGLSAKCTGGDKVEEGRDVIAADEVCTFGNVTIVASAIGQIMDRTYLEERLEQKLNGAPALNWKLAGYHYTLASMNPGIKRNEVSHTFFDIIRKAGAIGVQAHTHSAMASCPISSPFEKNKPIECHKDFGDDLESRFVLPGTGMYFDSSIGGKRPRARGRCHDPSDKGCRHMVDLISKEGYTRTDGTRKTKFNRLGALFIVFNAGGDANKAHAYYKSIDGQVIFKTDIARK